jgi:hypothetical protein
VNPNATWNVSLESYHPYLQPQEVSKGPTTLGTYSSLSENGKGRFGFLSPLGVKRLGIKNLLIFILMPIIEQYNEDKIQLTLYFYQLPKTYISQIKMINPSL